MVDRKALTPRRKRQIRTPEELNRMASATREKVGRFLGIDPHDDNPEWTKEDFARARPADEVHGPEIAAQMVRRRGRPPMAEGERKEAVKLRLSPEVLEHFRSGGPGWQTRIDEALRAAVEAPRTPKK